MSSKSGADLVSEYMRLARKYYEKSIAVLRKQLEYSEASTRTREDVTQIVAILEKCTIQKPLTAKEVLRSRHRGDLSKRLVVCSEDDAREIFDKGPPCFPILVAESPTQQRISVDWFLDVLETRASLDVHDFGKNINKKGRVAERVPSSSAIDMFKSRKETQLKGNQIYPLNFLNLNGIKDNAVPGFLANRTDFKILDLSCEENGKREYRTESTDLDESTSFHLLASQGAVHLPHVDHHYVYTTVFNEEGHKLWLMWPGLGIDGLRTWRHTGQVPDGGIPIYIAPGYTLVQPPGTMHWHSSQLHNILRYTKAEIEDPDITNESFSRQFIEKMTIILALWRRGSKAYTWPPDEYFNECLDILEVMAERRLRL
ncbi:uncharacterized protein FFB20_11009 [Fusarium fujikuroi]|nr:uncharacterized protein FFB20_11009 [Fusarium fujikuroi]SCO24282.1 uncharacterized protein FFE2_15910 [Fusarium fujikuroi]SCO25578.1 uncharacterized protein FFC1_15600 [Fusarium fujikuroi]